LHGPNCETVEKFGECKVVPGGGGHLKRHALRRVIDVRNGDSIVCTCGGQQKHEYVQANFAPESVRHEGNAELSDDITNTLKHLSACTALGTCRRHTGMAPITDTQVGSSTYLFVLTSWMPNCRRNPRFAITFCKLATV
jgi:hypothetical protein